MPWRSLQAEQVVAVVGPAVGGLVRLLREQGREVDLLEPGRVHLVADDVLDVAVDDPAERQPREPAGRGAPDVAGPHEQAVRWHLGVVGVVTQGPQEQCSTSGAPGQDTAGRRPARGDSRLRAVAPSAPERHLLRLHSETAIWLVDRKAWGEPHALLFVWREEAIEMTDTPLVKRVRRRSSTRSPPTSTSTSTTSSSAAARCASRSTPARVRPAASRLDQLALATRLLNRELDHDDPVPGKYTLEVTSPGVERTLRTAGALPARDRQDDHHPARRRRPPTSAGSRACSSPPTTAPPPSASPTAPTIVDQVVEIARRSIAPAPCSSGVRSPSPASPPAPRRPCRPSRPHGSPLASPMPARRRQGQKPKPPPARPKQQPPRPGRRDRA